MRILLFEGRIDEAWGAALSFGCAREQWMALARAGEGSRPVDAIDVYEPEAGFPPLGGLNRAGLVEAPRNQIR